MVQNMLDWTFNIIRSDVISTAYTDSVTLCSTPCGKIKTHRLKYSI